MEKALRLDEACGEARILLQKVKSGDVKGAKTAAPPGAGSTDHQKASFEQ